MGDSAQTRLAEGRTFVGAVQGAIGEAELDRPGESDAASASTAFCSSSLIWRVPYPPVR